MRTRVSFLAALSLIAASAAAQAPLRDFAGLKDPALFTRMPNFFLLSGASVADRQFDSYSLPAWRRTGTSRSPESTSVPQRRKSSRSRRPR